MRRFVLFFFCCTMLLSGCSDDTLAPVVNAWHQKGAASNYYIVQDDDTIYSIAFAFELNYRDIAQLNHLSPPYTLRSGRRILMPTGSVNAQPFVQPVKQARFVPERETYVSSGIFMMPTRGKIIHGFSGGYNGYHGVGIVGRYGQPIIAAAEGVVVYSGAGIRGYGNLIILKHGTHYLTAYAFNQRNRVHVGNHVRAGAVIAAMGRSGSGRAMLYFEIRRDGVPVDPMRYIGPKR